MLEIPFENGCDCNIPDGGYCERHSVRKTAHWVKLCRNREDYFETWENGTGPGQHSTTAANSESSKKSTIAKKPSGCGGCGDKKKALTLMGMGWDVGKAMLSFTFSGFRFVPRDEYQRRLDICTACENRGDERVRGNPHRCGECGCFVAVKAEAKAWQCPIGKWNKETVDGH